MRSASATFLTLLASLVGCNSDHRQSQFWTDDAVVLARELLRTPSLSEVDVECALHNARNAEQAVVFVRVDWSADSLIATFPFAQFMHDYYSSHRQSKLLFHYIDCTSISHDYAPLTDIPGWPELADRRRMPQGFGEVVWLKNGRVLRVESFCVVWNGSSWDVGVVKRFVAITDELMADAT